MFEPVNESLIEPQTYLYYIQSKDLISRPSAGVWRPYSEETERVLREDFKRLWATNFLDNLWIEVKDQPYSNGVMGKHVVFHMEERPRVKIVDYTGSSKIERTKVDEKMKEANVSLRLDSFLDQGAIRRVEGILRSLMSEKGYQFAEIKSSVEALPGGPKLVKVVFDVNEGPKVRVRSIDFVGNQAFSDGKLQGKMKETKTQWMFSLITGRGTFQEAKFEEDAEMVEGFYREQGYIQARIGQPEIKTLEDSKDKDTRWVELRIPVTEGQRYRVGEITFDGNTVVKSEFLRPLLKLEKGEWYSEKDVKKFFEKSREVYGGGGYMEFTGYPDYTFVNGAEGPVAGPAESSVNITMRLQEGEQYRVNRLTFTGNTTTRDNVIRREMRVIEGDIFNTEALKYSIRRLNQLGYFQNLEAVAGRRRCPEDAGREEQSRRDVEVAGAEPQPAHIRRRRFAVRGLLRSAVVPDVELPGPRRIADAVTAGRIARRKISARLHRAVPVRPQHHRRRRYLQALDRVHRPVHAESARREHHVRVPSGRLRPDVHDVLVRGRARHRSQPLYQDPPAHSEQHLSAGLVAHRPGRQAHREQGDAELRVQHHRQSDFPQRRTAPLAVERLRRAWREHQVYQTALRSHQHFPAHVADVHSVPRASRIHPALGQRMWRSRFSNGCSSAASTASAGSTFAPSVPASR